MAGLYTAVDVFAGKAAIGRRFLAKGWKACALDLSLNLADVTWLSFRVGFLMACSTARKCPPTVLWYVYGVKSEDICSPQGFVRHLWALISCRPGALVFLGVPCSSWVTVNRLLVAHLSSLVEVV